MTLSVIIPLYNEEKRFFKTAKSLEKFISTQKLFEKCELIFVDDGSTDNTVKVINDFSRKIPSTLINYKNNRGKGYAIKQGMMHATGDYALFLDADMSTEPFEIEKFMVEIRKDSPVIIGSRRSKGSEILIPQPLYRSFMGTVYTIVANIIIGIYIPDFTCGFKCFSRQAKEVIFKKSRVDRWSFDAEILFLAKLNGFNIITLPISWKNDDTTTVKLSRDIVTSFMDLLKVRIYHVCGKYDK